MEVTVWIERSLGLNVTKQVAHGSTIAALKAELLADDIFGSLDAKDLLLVAPRRSLEVLDDAVQLTEQLAELQIQAPAEEGAPEEGAPADPGGPGDPAGPEPPPPAEDAAGEAAGGGGGDWWAPEGASAALVPGEEWPEPASAGAAPPEAAWQGEAGDDAAAAEAGGGWHPEAEAVGAWASPPAEAWAEEPQRISELPKALGTELKWGVWNSMWYAANSHRAEGCGDDTQQAELLGKAAEDLERVNKHFQEAWEWHYLSEETLGHLKQQADEGGHLVAAACLEGSPLCSEAIQALTEPSQLDPALWSGMVAAMRSAALSVYENTMTTKQGQDPEQLWVHWLRGYHHQLEFENAWHQLYDSPATPPQENPTKWHAEAEIERIRSYKRAELERRALESKDTVIRTANGARGLLGKPLEYNVWADCPVYQEPMPQAKQLAQVKQGAVVYGYPGSAAWISIDPRDARCRSVPRELYLERTCWMPVRHQETSERELVLHAVWHELRPEKVFSDALSVSWPGVDQPVEPNVAEYAVEVRPKDGGKASTAVSGITKTRAVVRGLLPDTEVQLRVSLKVVGPYSTDFRLPGPWHDFQTAAPGAEEEAEAQAAQAAQAKAAQREEADLEPEGIYEVVHTFVTLRGQPTTKGMILGTLKKGACVIGRPFKVGEEAWVRLSPQTIPAATAHMPPRDIGPGDSVFMLIDATVIPSLKLGVLLKRVGDAGASDEKRKLGEWKVLADRVVVREKASASAATTGFHRKGAKILGVCLPIDGQDWLRVQNMKVTGVDNTDVWIQIAGADGGRLLERLGDAPQDSDQKKLRSLPRSSTRPTPPRPLTSAWLAAHGGLPVVPGTAREKELDPDLDVGMASQCSLVYVKPAEGGAEVSYVAKRGPPAGDMGGCGREYRFYTELAARRAGKGQDEPPLFGGVMRVPRCFCANWGKPGKENEGFILVMERLDDPDWVPVDPELGCSYEQAVVAVETLGRMHRAFSASRLDSREFDWLPVTTLDVRNVDGIQNFFNSLIHPNHPLVRMLPPGAQDTVSRMMEGGLGESFERLAEPPLVLNHGDYRVENLRFSAPGRPAAVAVFDWGLINLARGMADFAYFVMLSMRPEERRQREEELLARYLEARGDGRQSRSESWQDLRSASIAILGQILMCRHGAAYDAGPRSRAIRIILTRMMRWVGEAITDWRSIEAVS